jgi:hypothetical protein
MALVHELPGLIPVVSIECIGESQRAGVLCHDVMCPLKKRSREPVLRLEHGCFVAVAQLWNTEDCSGVSAIRSALSVLTICQGMSHVGVADEDADGRLAQRDESRGLIPAIDEQRTFLFAETAGKLIHESAGNVGELMLGALAEFCLFYGGHWVVERGLE